MIVKMNINQIVQYVHCGKCVDELQSNKALRSRFSPSSYSKLSIGFTKPGLQVWCERHDCNVMHIDFEHQQHPADMTRQKTDEERI